MPCATCTAQARSRLRYWASSGKLACLRTVSCHLLFRSEDVMAFLNAGA